MSSSTSTTLCACGSASSSAIDGICLTLMTLLAGGRELALGFDSYRDSPLPLSLRREGHEGQYVSRASGTTPMPSVRR